MTDRTSTDIATQLLAYLRTLPESHAAAEILETQLDIDSVSISSAIAQLREWGYAVNDDGGIVRLVASPDRLIDTEIGFGLGTDIVGRVLHTYQSVRSTNDIAHTLAESGAPEGTIVTAEEQTKGRGRHGRTWHSPPGTGIYVSIILRPDLPAERMPGLSLVVALALADAIADYCPANVQIKWPNDVLIDGRKTAGILTELFADRNSLHHVIVGVGINVLLQQSDFPEELQAIATSVGAHTHYPVRRVDLLQKFLRRFEVEYRDFRDNHLARALPRIRVMSSLLGNEVELDLHGRTERGQAIDIDMDGRLIVEIHGRRQAVTSGEVRVRPVGRP